jgi:hypothetical protein
MYIIATIQPLVYWIGILTTYSFLGLLSFASFKLIATLAGEAYYFSILVKYLDIPIRSLLKKSIYPIILPLIFLIASLVIVDGYLPYEKSKINLLIVLGSTGLCILISFIIQYMTSPNIRATAKNIIKQLTVTSFN